MTFAMAAPHAQSEGEYKQGIQTDTAECADECCRHGDTCLPLGRYKRIEPESKLDKESSIEIGADEVACESESLRACAKGDENRLLRNFKQHDENHGSTDERGGARAQEPFGTLEITSS